MTWDSEKAQALVNIPLQYGMFSGAWTFSESHVIDARVHANMD